METIFCKNCNRKLLQNSEDYMGVAIFGKPIILRKSSVVIKCPDCHSIFIVPVSIKFEKGLEK